MKLNRQQRRAMQKQQQQQGTPIKAPLAGKEQMRRELDRQLDQELDKIRTEAANRSFNLIMGGMILVLLESGSKVNEVEHLIHRIVDKMEGVMGNGITFEELMHTCNKKGFAIGDMDYNKVKKTADEVMGMIRKYERMKDMSTKTDVFTRLNAGETDCSKIASELNVSKKTVETYRSAWNKEQKKMKLAEKTPEQLADELFGEDESPVQEITAEQAVEELKEAVKTIVEDALKAEDQEEAVEHIADVGKMVEEEKIEEEVPVMKTGLKKIVKVVAIEGEFATYAPVEACKSFSVEIDGQVLVLSREQMRTFGQELIEVADEEL